MAAAIGNKYAVKNREWFDAIRKQCVQRKALDGIARVLVDKALEGEQWAVQEIANRYDGKPAQAIQLTGDPDNPITFSRIERVIVENGYQPQMGVDVSLRAIELEHAKQVVEDALDEFVERDGLGE